MKVISVTCMPGTNETSLEVGFPIAPFKMSTKNAENDQRDQRLDLKKAANVAFDRQAS